MAKAKLDDGGAVVAEAEAFYHFGLVPAAGPVKLWLPSKTEMKEELRTYAAYDLWNGGERGLGDIQMFAAKARQFNGLTVRGWHFHATSQSAVARGQNVDRVDYPGQVAWMDTKKVAEIAEACHKSFIRWEHGVDRADDPRSKAYVWDMDFGKRPEGMPDDEWRKYMQNGQSKCPAFNPRTDRYVSEFVYIQRLDYDRARLDEREYQHNRNRFHVQMVTPFSREWFENPPKSVAEMYPKEKA